MFTVDENRVAHVSMKDLKEMSSMSDLCELEDDDFIKYFEGKDLGYVKSCIVLISSMYSQVRIVKDDTLDRIKAKVLSIETPEVKKFVDDCFAVMFRLEHKYFILKDIEKKRAII